MRRESPLHLLRGAVRRAVRAVRAPSGDDERNVADDRNIRLLAAFLLRQDANCIDVGSSEGSFVREALRIAPGGRHIAYEPLPEFAARLRTLFPSVDVRQRAASDRAGTSSFVFVRSRPGMSGLRRRTYPGPETTEELTVELERIDDALPDGYVPTLIKIDVEGAELQVLRGAIETIRRHRPTIVFEHGSGGAEHYGTTPGEVFDLLVNDAGLRIFDIDGDGPYTRDEFERMFSSPVLWNFVAHE